MIAQFFDLVNGHFLKGRGNWIELKIQDGLVDEETRVEEGHGDDHRPEKPLNDVPTLRDVPETVHCRFLEIPGNCNQKSE